MKKELVRYLRVWIRLTLGSFRIALQSRIGAGIFIVAKLVRFGLLFAFLAVITTKTRVFAGYSQAQVFIFFLTFNCIDTISQCLFREVYRFREKIVTGDFDLLLVKPYSPLIRALFGGTDPLDAMLIIPYVAMLGFIIAKVTTIDIFDMALFLMLAINGIIIAAAFHILVLALGIVTTEVDHAILIYRDVSQMTRFPITIYEEPIRSLITFVVPVGIMVSFPAQALLGTLQLPFVLLSVVFAGSLLTLSLLMWRLALRHYTSASS